MVIIPVTQFFPERQVEMVDVVEKFYEFLFQGRVVPVVFAEGWVHGFAFLDFSLRSK
jgi:pyruvoyl-dependent arginine decarboxylase (PvlArgDC)